MLKKAVAAAVLAALLLALLAPAAVLAQGADVQEPERRNPEELVNVVKTIVHYVTLFAGFALLGIAAWMGVQIAMGGPNVHRRGELLSGILYLVLGAMVCFGASFWLGIAKGLIPGAK